MRKFTLHNMMGFGSRIGPVDDIPEDVGFGLCSTFDEKNFDPQGAGTKGNMKIGTYRTTADSLATVEASGYFSSSFVSTTSKTGDLLVVNASDGVATYVMTVSGTTVTIAKVPGDQLVTTADSDITLPGHGHVLLPSTAASLLSLGPLAVGETVSMIKSGGSTEITVVIPSSSLVFFGNASNRKLSFNAIEEAVILKGQSATRIDVISNVGSVAIATT